MWNTTLCYIEREGQYLMLHRVKKENDINKDKWIGIGGKFEDKESPEECLVREVREETGLTLTDYTYRGLVTFVSDRWVTEYMHLFTARTEEDPTVVCDEGDLEWVYKDKVQDLPIWTGDKIFLDLLTQNVPFFSLKLEYVGDTLVRAVLNGKELPTQGCPLPSLWGNLPERKTPAGPEWACRFDVLDAVEEGAGVHQFPNLGLPVDGEPVFLQHLGGHAVPLHQGFGEGAVVDLPAAAGGAAFLQQGGLAPVEVGQAEDLRRTPEEGLGDVFPVPGDHPAALALRRGAGGGQAPHLLRADGDAGVGFEQFLQLGELVVAAVVPAAHPQQAGTDQQFHGSPLTGPGPGPRRPPGSPPTPGRRPRPGWAA